MANKIIGFYDSRERAERVENDLIQAGFGRSDVRTYEGSDEPGLWDRMREWFGYAEEEDRQLYHEAARRGGVAVVCDTSDDDTPSGERAAAVMQRHNPIDLERQSAQWRSEGWQGATASTTGRDTTRTGTRDTTRGDSRSEDIPVVKEEMHIGKRRVLQGGVRIHSRVVERPVEEDVQLREEHVKVQRQPADRPVRPGDRAFEERTIEASETSERAVVDKQAKVVEEINVRKDVSQRTEKVRDSVRHTEVDVEKLAGDRPGATTGGTSGGAFDARSFVSEMGRDKRYADRDWETCEPDFRRSYEQRYPQSKWEQVRDQVRAEHTRSRSRA